MNDYMFLIKSWSLTKQYEDHVRTYNGLGTMFAGSVYGLIALFYCLVGPGALLAALTVSLVLMWLVGKGFLQRHFYNAFGQEDDESVARVTPFSKKLLVILSTGLVLCFWAVLLLTGHLLTPHLWLCDFIISCLPIITWKYLRTWFDFMTGFNLWLLGAAASIGHPFGLTAQALSDLLAFGIVLFFLGLWLHLDYHRIVNAVKELKHGYQ